jgi:tetratricopeptide (TPR) repeat protein
LEFGKVRNNRKQRISKRLVIICLFLMFAAYSVSAADGFVFRITVDDEYFNIAFKSESEIKESSCRHLTSRLWIYFLFLPGVVAFIILFFNRKKAAAVFIIFSVFLITGVSDPFPSENIRNGFDNLKNGFYDDALADFMEADTILPCNPALKYNLALCYYLTENKSSALCYLRRSIVLDPQDEEPRNVLSIIEKKLELVNQVPPGIRLHPDVPFIYFIIFINLTLILLGLVYRYKKGVLFISFVFFVFLSACALIFYVYSITEMDENVGIVLNDEGILKKIPMDIANAWISFKMGTSLKINGFADGYWLVRSELGFEGFIHESDLLLVHE